MIDLHSHILPGLDDGAASWAESLAMCRLAVEDGITEMVASPHILAGLYNNNLKNITAKVLELKDRLDEQKLNLKIHVGGDIRITPEILLVRNQNRLPLLGKNGCKYLLLEFPSQLVPPASRQLIFLLVTQGVIPIITHPERNFAMQQNPKILLDLINNGAYCQLTAMSITGGFGPLVQRCALYFLKNCWVHVIASDAHSPDLRPPLLSAAVKAAGEILGAREAEKLVRDNPAAVLEGRAIN